MSSVEWRVSQYRLVHPVHDTFFISPADEASARFRASRVCVDLTQPSGLRCEHIPEVGDDELPRYFDSLEGAQAAVAARIADLDAQQSECLEACREVDTEDADDSEFLIEAGVLP